MQQKIKLIEPLGFCYGVKRAVNLAEHVIENKPNKKIYSLGGIIHNKDAVRELSRKGLIVKSDLKGVKKGDTLIISSHGVRPAILKEAKKKGIKTVNATCPNVITSQRLCERLKNEGYLTIIVGDKHHREIESLCAFAGKNSLVVKDEVEARSKKVKAKRIGVIVQTTQSKDNFVKVLKELIVKDYTELRIFDTICNDTSRRQKAALNLAKKVDTIFVVGGKHSANTRRLFELCKKVRKKCYYLENDKGLKFENLKSSKAVGVVSGASTPNWVIADVLEKIKKLQKERG